MSADLAVDLFHATVMIEQALGTGNSAVGAGFLVAAPTPARAPRTVLVTSAHVFDRMPGVQARIGWRVRGEAGAWRYAPAPLTIRTTPPAARPDASRSPAEARPLWVRHPTQDIAVMTVQAPPEFTRAAIPLAWLADDATFARRGVGPGDEMMALGFPRGLSSNRAGFPILRWGRVASYPLAPGSAYPTFLLDFRVFDGNSGGPVFAAASGAGPGFVAGVVVKQVENRGDRLELGVVSHARHVREALALLDAGGSLGASSSLSSGAALYAPRVTAAPKNGHPASFAAGLAPMPPPLRGPSPVVFAMGEERSSAPRLIWAEPGYGVDSDSGEGHPRLALAGERVPSSARDAAEGATAPETLRPQGPRRQRTLESGVVKAAPADGARRFRPSESLRLKDSGGAAWEPPRPTQPDRGA